MKTSKELEALGFEPVIQEEKYKRLRRMMRHAYSSGLGGAHAREMQLQEEQRKTRLADAGYRSGLNNT